MSYTCQQNKSITELISEFILRVSTVIHSISSSWRTCCYGVLDHPPSVGSSGFRAVSSVGIGSSSYASDYAKSSWMTDSVNFAASLP